MNDTADWEANVYAGLEQLDEEGRNRVSRLGSLEPEREEPKLATGSLPDLGELELAMQPPRLA